jgi:hypothetical protein
MNSRTIISLLIALYSPVFAIAQETPTRPIKLFNGKDLTGLTTWLKDGKREDPRKVFSAREGVLHVSGDGFGYVATEKEYKNYHLVVANTCATPASSCTRPDPTAAPMASGCPASNASSHKAASAT